MPLPTLESLEGRMDDACMSILGDSIAYTPVAGAVVTRGYVDYRDALREIETGQVIAQDITVGILIAAAPARPTTPCRITLAKAPGFTFKPVNVRRDQSGTHWEFELDKVNA